MAKPISNADADGTIEALLEQRAQYEQWLAKLESTADKAPPSVRERVRSDYEVRLHRVIDDLRGHSAAIAQELEHHRTVERELDAERRKAEETLAEAEVRHVVGEYGDEEWDRLSGESRRHLDGLRGELENVGVEIARLAEVQALIAAPPRTREAAAVPMVAPASSAPVAPTPSPSPVSIQPALFEVTEPSSPPAAPVSPEPVVVASPVDELAFLKSVSDEERKPAAAPRRSAGGSGTVSVKPVEQAVAPVPSAVSAPAAPVPMPSAPAPAPAATSTVTTTSAGKTAGMAKTLKCNECGTFNRPTEWYCERCGAELAAL
jgi:hypothetical protein